MSEPYTYEGESLREVAFPLGGIGTGCVSLDGRGALCDWEIFNRPSKGRLLEHTFAALWYQAEGQVAQTRLVQGPRQRDFIGGGTGQIRQHGDGLPHFGNVRFHGRFPSAYLSFHHEGCPLDVNLHAFNPFIPLHEHDSSMPVACLTYTVRNTTDRPVRATLAFSMLNPIGHSADVSEDDPHQALNGWRDGPACRGIVYTNERFTGTHPRAGTAAVTTDWADVIAMPHWPRQTRWFDGMEHFWQTFSHNGAFDGGPTYDNPGQPVAGTLGLRATLQPGASVEMPVLISWCFPNNSKYWGTSDKLPEADRFTWVNDYAKRYPTAWDAADDFFTRRQALTSRTQRFEDTLFSSSLPSEVIESLSATASILHTPTCIRAEDGTFWAWEGCNDHAGCCPGSCTHVWNYALTQAYLFPAMHRGMRRSEYDHSFEGGESGQQGAIFFRIPLPLSDTQTFTDPRWHHAASDGQLGGIVQLYRDWRLCGDDAYLKHMWPSARKALEYAWVMWDTDKDGLVDGDQHNTYDINFQGPNPLTQCFYLAALTAGARMARYLGDDNAATEYERIANAGRAKTRARLFNGAFMVQTCDCLADDAPRDQHGLGCLSDQVFGQLAAHVAGLDYVLDEDIVKASLAAVFKHNFRDPLGDHANVQRIYAVNDESGLLLCSWPNGGRPRIPFPYSDEVWTGIEYQVATHLVYEGMFDEALAICRAVRKRYDGQRRNPYDEFECGHHYARALASWGLLLAISGFRYDAVDKTLHVTPRGPRADDMRCLFTAASAWGSFTYDGKTLTLDVEEGALTIDRVRLVDRTIDVPAEQRNARAGAAWTLTL